MKHLDNYYMLLAWGAGIFLQVLVTEIPYFVKLFGTSRLSLQEWGVLFVLSSMPLVIHELLVFSDFLINGSEKSEKPEDRKQKKQAGREPGEII